MPKNLDLYIASDHAGFAAKESLKKVFSDIQWTDLGPRSTESVHYPDFAHELCQKILENYHGPRLLEPLAVLICGSGVGMSMAANRHKGIRAVLAHRSDVARASREHNASNVLCLGSRFNSDEELKEIFELWIATAFEGGRHLERLEKIEEFR